MGISFDALTFLIPLMAGFVMWLAAEKASAKPIGAYQSTENEQQRIRIAIAERVQQRWVDDVLHKSLHGAVLIDLGMQRQPHEVAYPWDMRIQIGDQPDQMLPPNTHISMVFDAARQSLLILGEPGSGKSTIMLELTASLLERTNAPGSIAPVPVVFTLSTSEHNCPSRSANSGYLASSRVAPDVWCSNQHRTIFARPQ
ncbi:MAG: hypothetical protein IPK16_25880 [Anaerolineales bacterium]|nr:hypothetical protein [Anaerolineales bacterium]